MKTIEELYNIAEHALDGFEAGCYALEYHDVEEDDGIPYEDGELAYAFFSIDSNGCLAYLGYALDCSHCLNCRFLFSVYAPLPVPEALLPITPLAPGCPYDLPWLRNARTEPDAAGKAQKTFASQNSSPYGFLVPPCPWSEPVRLPDHKEGHKGPHQVPRRSS